MRSQPGCRWAGRNRGKVGHLNPDPATDPRGSSNAALIPAGAVTVELLAIASKPTKASPLWPASTVTEGAVMLVELAFY